MRRHLCVGASLISLACGSPTSGGQAETAIDPTVANDDDDVEESSDDVDTSSTNSTDPGDGDPGDGDPGDGDPDDDDGSLPKFDLSPIPDGGGGGGGGEIGIPETCAVAEDNASAVGCLFYGLDLNNFSDTDPQQYGIIVSNVQEDDAAEVVVEEKQGNNWVTISGPFSIPPLDSHAFLLPDNHQEGSGLAVGGAYRVTSDEPVVAYQFNPINGQQSFTTDASLLYPVPSYDYIYQVLGYHVTIGYSSYINIIAAYDGTEVEVTPSVATVAGPGIPAGVPGVPFLVQLDEGDVAQISTQAGMSSLTGTEVLTDDNHPVGVLSGTECTNTGQGACDHMEDMLTGVRLWGLEFVASRMPIRQLNAPEPTIWQIYASEDNTTVIIDADGEVSGLPGSPVHLDKGEKVEFPASGTPGNPGDFHIEADKPIAVMGYLVGINSGEGDPAMVLMSPVQQYLPRYVVLVPGTWVNDYLVITRHAGTTVQVDGVPVDEVAFVPVGDGDFEVARVLTPDGVHTIDGLGDPCSVVVVGFDEYDSYAYLGGVGTSVINPSPAG
jgi:IgGFc binding protein